MEPSSIRWCVWRSMGSLRTRRTRRPSTSRTTVSPTVAPVSLLHPGSPLPCSPSTHSPFPGFNPRWDETLQFQLHVPELALVRFVVEDYDKTSRNDFVGQFTLAFANIKPGEQLLPGGGGGAKGSPTGVSGLSWVLEGRVGGSCQPDLCCHPYRLPPHPSPLQGWHQHPTLFTLCPYPHH